MNTNNGSITPVGSVNPLSSNEIATLALQTHAVNPLPLASIAPYIDLSTVPWVAPAIDAIDVDFKRVYEPTGSLAPLNFTDLPSWISASPSHIAGPLTTLTPASPTTYVQPQTSSLPSPNLNLNPLGTDVLTSPLSNPSSLTPINPMAIDLPPVPPTLYPDTWKYFDFLKAGNPFNFNVSDYLPQLPTTSCYYEIHRTFNVPFLGVKHFDIAPCQPLQPLRTVLAWAFAVLSMWVCFVVIFRSHI